MSTMDRLKDTRVWDDALSRVLGRIEATANSVERGFPHYADITTGRSTVSDNGDWTDEHFDRAQIWHQTIAAVHRIRGVVRPSHPLSYADHHGGEHYDVVS
jgi:hypothetical protein